MIYHNNLIIVLNCTCSFKVSGPEGSTADIIVSGGCRSWCSGFEPGGFQQDKLGQKTSHSFK